MAQKALPVKFQLIGINTEELSKNKGNQTTKLL